MVFVKVMCVHRYFTKEKRNTLGDLLRMMVAQELGIEVDPISVAFTEQAVYGPKEHVLIEVLIFQRCGPFSHDGLAKELCRMAQGCFESLDMTTAKIACLVDTGVGDRGFAVSRE